MIYFVLTGLWRVNGTIAYFISAGVRLLPPSLFVLSAFLLTAVMSLAIGTSFGVVATAGVILIAGLVPIWHWIREKSLRIQH